MAIAAVQDLKSRAQAAWENLSAQTKGLEPYLERAAEPGEWTARESLSHVLSAPGWDMVAVLKSFVAQGDLPVVEIEPGDTYVTAGRRTMTLAQLMAALDGQRRDVLAYLDTLTEADLARKARIPLFKTFMGTDEITLPVFIGAMFEFHWNDHASQLAKIRQAIGLPAVS